MRLLFVVQRYGADVAGGSEQCCREFATRLAERGHRVDVLTSCARSYVDWADYYPPGTETIAGVSVHRLPVRRPRDDVRFGPLNARVPHGHKPVPLFLQEEWMREQGPDLPGLAPWLEDHVREYDVAIFFTYLYQTTYVGLPIAARQVPTMLHPTAHDEPPFYLSLFDLALRQADVVGYLTPEEADLFERRMHFKPRSCTVGIGIDLPSDGARVDSAGFRQAFGVGSRPYLIYLGRVDPSKGTNDLHELFLQYKKRNPGDLALVMMGEPVAPPPVSEDVILTGFVSPDVREVALRSALALVQPSRFESFSMVLAEAWSVRTPALVQGTNAVLLGHAKRSGGALSFASSAEFDAAVLALLADPRRAAELGDNGRRYLADNYSWDVVLDRYERELDLLRPMRAR